MGQKTYHLAAQNINNKLLIESVAPARPGLI